MILVEEVKQEIHKLYTKKLHHFGEVVLGVVFHKATAKYDEICVHFGQRKRNTFFCITEPRFVRRSSVTKTTGWLFRKAHSSIFVYLAAADLSEAAKMEAGKTRNRVKLKLKTSIPNAKQNYFNATNMNNSL